MLRKSSSHFIAHVVTAFVSRLSEAIHEVAAARAHTEVLAALGGFGKREKQAGRSRPLRVNKKKTDAVETETVAKRVAKGTPKKTAKKTSKKTSKKTTKRTAKTIAKRTSQIADAKSMPQPMTKKVRAKAKPATRAKAAATSTALAQQATAKRKDSRPATPTRTQGATPDASALIPTEQPAAREVPPVPPGSVVASADAAPATTG